MVEYHIYNEDLRDISIADGFWEYWPTHPDKTTHREILANSYKAIVAIEHDEIIGFITIISDGIISAYIPLLEVIPSYRGQGIGRRLVELAMKEMENIYMLDLSCDSNLVDFYEKFGMNKTNAMIKRNYASQSGKNNN